MTDPASIRARALAALATAESPCPACGSDDTTGGNITVEDGRAYQPMSCSECPASWTEGYHRVSMLDIELDDDERVVSLVSIANRLASTDLSAAELDTIVAALDFMADRSEVDDRRAVPACVDADDLSSAPLTRLAHRVRDLAVARSEAPPFSFAAYRSDVDGVPVVHIDTDAIPEVDGEPSCRIYLNDSGSPLFANPDLDPAR